jgi:hypothetical protein
MLVFWAVGLFILVSLVMFVHALLVYREVLDYKRKERYLQILPTLLK